MNLWQFVLHKTYAFYIIGLCRGKGFINRVTITPFWGLPVSSIIRLGSFSYPWPWCVRSLPHAQDRVRLFCKKDGLWGLWINLLANMDRGWQNVNKNKWYLTRSSLTKFSSALLITAAAAIVGWRERDSVLTLGDYIFRKMRIAAGFPT